MCGVIGYISYQKKSSCDINKMLHSIKHRGPDAHNFKEFQIIMGYSIIGIIAVVLIITFIVHKIKNN